MAATNTKSAMTDMQSMFDPRGYENVFKTFAEMNERATEMFVDAGKRSVEIASNSATESFDNMREAAQLRDEPAEYGRSFTDFLQKQMELTARTMQSFAEVTQKTAHNAAELGQDAGKTVADKTAENAERAADKAGSAAKKAA